MNLTVKPNCQQLVTSFENIFNICICAQTVRRPNTLKTQVSNLSLDIYRRRSEPTCYQSSERKHKPQSSQRKHKPSGSVQQNRLHKNGERKQ